MYSFDIDPYEALITLAQSDTDLTAVVGTQINVWHRYGQDVGDWPQNSQSLVLRPFAGEFHTDDQATVAWSRPVIEARCYGQSPYDCGQVWMQLMNLCSRTYRQIVDVNGVDALVNYFRPQQGGGMPRLLFDEDAKPGRWYTVLFSKFNR